nr:uncharacterized protein LOC106679956 [Halyomorpha halys]
MIKYLFFIFSIYQVCQSSVMAISIPDQQLLSPIFQDIEGPQTLPGPNISSPDDTAEMKDIEVQDNKYGYPAGMIPCWSKGWCCYPDEVCGPFKICYNPNELERMGRQVPC